MTTFTLETVPAKGCSNRRHFRKLNAALLAFHIQRCGGEYAQVLLWDNRSGTVIRHYQA